MAVGRRIAELNSRELLVLCKIFFRHPFYLIPTYRATNDAVKISTRLYGNLHHEDNRTNAFRHALWNYLLSEYCLSVAGSIEKTVEWSKKITDLHERLSPNEKLAKAMDLHNNKIGRELFLNNFEKNENIVPLLQKMTREAVKVSTIPEIEREKEKLFFIEEIKIP